ncbi:MAG TPA: hypothetical protein VF049_11420 [Nocardioidaceae bacterium]|jgi:acyl carrier protein
MSSTQLTAVQAHDLVTRAIRRIVPDADVTVVSPDADLRLAYELDPLDFLGFVELLSEDSGARIDREDYPELATVAGCVAFLERRTG